MNAWRDLMRHLFRDRVAELLDAHDADCDHWEPCAYEDNWLCRVHCPRCMPLSPCLGHDRVWAAVMNEQLRCQP